MNGPISMYTLKPVVHFSDGVEISTSMYRMKNIYSSNFSSSEVIQGPSTLPNILEQVNKLLKQKPVPGIEDLKKRQEAILKQLTYLKEQMSALREELSKKTLNTGSSNDIFKNGEIGAIHQKISREPSWNSIVGEIVISASPENPPYSLLAINQIWPEVLRLHVTCHTHSSILTLPTDLVAFSSLALTSSPTMRAKLIWKQMGSDCELIISPLNHCSIRGEVNFLRYLYRTVCAANDSVTETRLDNTLDICYRLTHARTMRDKQLLVRALNSQLGKAAWLGGQVMSVADLAAWSAVQSMSGVELSQNLTRWKSRCCSAAGVDAA